MYVYVSHEITAMLSPGWCMGVVIEKRDGSEKNMEQYEPRFLDNADACDCFNNFNFIKLRFSGSHEFSFCIFFSMFPRRTKHKLIWIILLYPMNKYWCSLIRYHWEKQQRRQHAICLLKFCVFFFSTSFISFMFQVSVAYGASDELCVCVCVYMSLYVCLICHQPLDETGGITWKHFFFVSLSTFPALACNLFLSRICFLATL